MAKAEEVCIKARSPPASLPFKGWATEHTTLKWPISEVNIQTFAPGFLDRKF